MDKHEQIHKTKLQIFINNFLGGVAWGLGATVGVSIFLAIFAFVLKQVNLIPVVGGFVSGVATYVFQNNPQLLGR